MNLTNLETALGYSFKDKALLKESLTHRSYLNENPSWGVPHNERLEFLGDAVLELVVTEDLMNRFPDDDEGKLTALRASLVNYQSMAETATQIDLGASVLLSKGEAKDMGRAREVILANAMEAVIGALYLDGGYPACKRFIGETVMKRLQGVMKEGYRDPKSILQEATQAKRKLTPVYKVLGETGPEHKKIFRVGVYFENALIAEGEGYSKQDAEVEAAKAALEKIS